MLLFHLRKDVTNFEWFGGYVQTFDLNFCCVLWVYDPWLQAENDINFLLKTAFIIIYYCVVHDLEGRDMGRWEIGC